MDHSPRASRQSAAISAVLLSPGGTPVGRGLVKNVSETGLCVEHARSWPRGASVGLEIPATPGRGRITLLGEVRWSDGRAAGVEVAAMMPHHRARFSNLLDELSHRPPRLPATLTSEEGGAAEYEAA